MNITMTTDEIVSLLNVSSGTFRNISSKGKVGERLLAIGYELIHQYKDGKFNVYEIRKLDNVTWSEIQAKHNIKDSNKNIHSKYSITRLKSMDKSRKQVISDSDTNIAYTTAKRYDDILLQEKVMKNRQQVYFLINMDTDTMTEISEFEYKTFWIDHKELNRQLKCYKLKREKYEISDDAYDYLVSKAYNSFGKSENEIAIKFMTYQQAENTMKILDELEKSNMSSLVL